MKNVDLSIPDMQSAHCQGRVISSIKDIQDVNIEKLEAGKLSISVESDEVKKKLIEAIEKAGYKVEDNDANSSTSCSASCCSTKD